MTMTDAEEERIIRRITEALRRNGRNWQPIVTQILIALAPTLGAFVLWLKANSTHDLVNSRMTELLAITKREGRQEAEDQQRNAVYSADADKPFIEALKELLHKYEGK